MCEVSFEKTFACRFVPGALVRAGRDTAVEMRIVSICAGDAEYLVGVAPASPLSLRV